MKFTGAKFVLCMYSIYKGTKFKGASGVMESVAGNRVCNIFLRKLQHTQGLSLTEILPFTLTIHLCK